MYDPGRGCVVNVVRELSVVRKLSRLPNRNVAFLSPSRVSNADWAISDRIDGWRRAYPRRMDLLQAEAQPPLQRPEETGLQDRWTQKLSPVGARLAGAGDSMRQVLSF